MKKILTLFCVVMLAAFVGKADEIRMQGVPVHGTLEAKVKAMKPAKAPSNADTFTFDDIQIWAGEGDCEAALVLQWNVEGETNALVWGYRWNSGEKKTGMEMFAAVAATDTRLYYIASATSMGYTLGGIGYDVDGNGSRSIVKDGTELTAGENGMINMSGYGYEGWTSTDASDYWGAGWMNSYWSYYVAENKSFSTLGYSGYGISNRTLSDGSVDAWNFAKDMDSSEWLPLAAASAATTTPTLPTAYTDGLFIQNEGWFGHDMGSINWVASDGTVYYNVNSKANGNQVVLGNTSQFGRIYGENYFVTSKQAPRFVVFDATTLECKATFDELVSADGSDAGDGRDVIAIDNNKAYVGGYYGIMVYDVAAGEFSKMVDGTLEEQNRTSNVMVRVGKYVFAAKQRLGVLVIDPEKDAVVKTIESSAVTGGLVVSKDGNLWACAGTNILRINPVTLEYVEVAAPSTVGDGWAYPAKICASLTENALFYESGTSSWSLNQISKLLIDEEGNVSEDANFKFTMPAADDASQTQVLYSAPGFDPISGNVVVCTTQSGYGTNYSHNWLHFIDPATGAIVKTITLKDDDGKDSYWFPSLPIFPDNAAPEINLDDIVLADSAKDFNVVDFVSDADNLAALAVVESAEIDNTSVATVDYDGIKLSVVPVANGSTDLLLSVNSNGKTVEKTVSVTVTGLASVSENALMGVSAVMIGTDLHINGANEGVATVYNMMGAAVTNVNLSESTVIDMSVVAAGTYVVSIQSKSVNKIIKIVKF